MTISTIGEAQAMVAGMTPQLQPGQYVFVSVLPDQATECRAHALGAFREAEGESLILPIDIASSQRLPISNVMRCITLCVYSALDGVGLTAAVAGALATHGIPCNMVAAYHHDHMFVPEDRAEQALQILLALQQSARA